MNTALALFENKRVRKYMKTQFKNIRNSKIDPEVILAQLAEFFKEKYCLTKISSSEIAIKADKKKNIQQLETEIQKQLVYYINGTNIDVSFLFKIMRDNNELIVRAKRYNG